jgi:DUF917 family protein
MGSPLIGIEKIPSGKEYYFSLKCLSDYLKKETTKITSIEIGGINSIVPFIVSIDSKKFIIDGDYEGRAFPELYMTTMHFSGIKATPMAITDERNNCIIINSINNFQAEKIAREITVNFGGRGYISIYPVNGEDYSKSAIKGTLTLAFNLGKALIDGKLDELLKISHGEIIYSGKIIDIKRNNLHGFNSGKIELEGIEEYKDSTAEIYFKNEYLAFLRDKRIIAIAPDIINLITTNDTVLTTDSIKYGLRVFVLRIPISSKWKETEGYNYIQNNIINYLKKQNSIQ